MTLKISLMQYFISWSLFIFATCSSPLISAFAPVSRRNYNSKNIISPARERLTRTHESSNNNNNNNNNASSKTSILHKDTLRQKESFLNNDFDDLNCEESIDLPFHATHDSVNEIISRAQDLLFDLHKCSLTNDSSSDMLPEENSGIEKVYTNSYVDLGKVDTVGFDYDYTLVTYTKELLDLIYDMALQRLVKDKSYPLEMLDAGMKFDPKFSIRGLAVDRETGWICHLSYTHKVAVAWEGRKKVSRQRLINEYRGKRSLKPSERKKRLKPLNDLFSMAECCLIADSVQFFKDRDIPFCARNAVDDILGAIGATHISGDFHRMVAKHPEKYFEPKPYLATVLNNLKSSGKRLIFVSNSPYWYVNSGMTFFFGENWQDIWDAVIVSAGKPNFYTDDKRPFREVSRSTERVKFKTINKIEPNEIYTEGCLRELVKCLDWSSEPYQAISEDDDVQSQVTGGSSLASPNVLYIGDSLFADLVDAKREYGWTTAAVAPEVGWEIELVEKKEYLRAQRTIDLLLHTLRRVQSELGNGMRSDDDYELLNNLEEMVSYWRGKQNKLLGNPFGSVFRAQYQPSLFSHSLRRYCDLYMSDVSSLRHYSPQHRFYPDDFRLLSHETSEIGKDEECWDLKNTI